MFFFFFFNIPITICHCFVTTRIVGVWLPLVTNRIFHKLKCRREKLLKSDRSEVWLYEGHAVLHFQTRCDVCHQQGLWHNMRALCWDVAQGASGLVVKKNKEGKKKLHDCICQILPSILSAEFHGHGECYDYPTINNSLFEIHFYALQCPHSRGYYLFK